MDLLKKTEWELRNEAKKYRAEADRLLAAAQAIKAVRAGERSPAGKRGKRSGAPKRKSSSQIKPPHQGQGGRTTLDLGTSTQPDPIPEDRELVHTTQAGERDG